MHRIGLLFALILIACGSQLQALPVPDKIPPYCASNAITYSFSGGRFGDNLIAYFHARWLAYKYGLPLIYLPFNYSDEFALHQTDLKRHDFSYKHHKVLRREKDLLSNSSPTLFTVPFFPDSRFEYEMFSDNEMFETEVDPLYFEVEWDDPGFKAEMIRCLMPVRAIDIPLLPKEVINVGVHVRRGGKFDNYHEVKQVYPLKFPPDDYYIEQIKRIARIFEGRPLSVHLLTDDLEPFKMVETYQKAINNPNVTINHRISPNSDYEAVLEDFLTIPLFDCMIICQSNFSLIASKLGDYAVLITPINAISKGKHFIIDEIEVKINSDHQLFQTLGSNEKN